jgi:hypothetical protein
MLWKKPAPEESVAHTKMGKPKKAKAKVVQMPLPRQAAIDYPDDAWEKSGSKAYEMLKERHRKNLKLDPLQQFLFSKYFPAQKKRVEKVKQSKETERENQRSEKQAKQTRKENREIEQAEIYACKV